MEIIYQNIGCLEDKVTGPPVGNCCVGGTKDNLEAKMNSIGNKKK